MYFDELDLNDDILDGLDAMNFSKCTPIQEQAIPVILERNDILGSAQTGTGKTAAYLLPLLELLSRNNQHKNKVNALILVPTRELALQVDQLLCGFAYYTDISWIAVYGGNDGVAFAQQEKALKTGGDIAIATPGRLLSHLRTNNVDFSCIEYLILDEADRMLDIGFYDDIMEIISYLPPKRQTLMFSATFPTEVESLAKKILNNPVEVKIAVSKPAEGIDQGIYLLNENQKNPLLKEIFKEKTGKNIIFSSSKEKVWEIYIRFKQQGVNIEQMHSGLLQEKRKEVMLNFKNNKLQAIVATDIVSRGIDIDDVELVINYDVPKQAEDYVHRIGRTARAGAKGRAITFVSPKDRFHFDKIEKFLGKPINRLLLPEKIAEMAPPIEDKPATPKKKKFYSPKRKNNKRSGKQKNKNPKSVG